MRYAVFSGGLLLAIAVGMGLRGDGPVGVWPSAGAVHTDVLRTSLVGAAYSGPTVAIPTARAVDLSLVFIAPPTRVTMPLLPDIPAPPLLMADRDPLPQIQNPPLVVTDIEPVARPARTDSGPASGIKGEITGNALNLRAGPAKRHDAVAALYAGDGVTITGDRDGLWVPVRLASSGIEGWVFHKYVQAVNSR